MFVLIGWCIWLRFLCHVLLIVSDNRRYKFGIGAVNLLHFGMGRETGAALPVWIDRCFNAPSHDRIPQLWSKSGSGSHSWLYDAPLDRPAETVVQSSRSWHMLRLAPSLDRWRRLTEDGTSWLPNAPVCVHLFLSMTREWTRQSCWVTLYIYIYIYIFFFFISDGGSERTVGFFMLVFIGLAMNGKFVARLLTRKHIKKYIYMFIYMFMHWTILRVSVFIWIGNLKKKSIYVYMYTFFFV